MLIDSFANRLDLALKRNNMRPIDLANKTHIDKSSISRYLSGNWKASQKRLTIIAMALNTNEAWLMGYDVPSEPNESHLTFKEVQVGKEKSNSMSLDEKNQRMLDYMNKNNIDTLFTIPLYSSIKVSLNNSEQYIEGYIPLNPHMYNMKNPDDYFYIKMMDDSMDKKYQEGDYVLMKKASNIINDSISLVIIDNKTIIRKITSQGNLLLLEPLSNNNKYKTKVCEKTKVKIIATVIGFIGYERSN